MENTMEKIEKVSTRASSSANPESSLNSEGNPQESPVSSKTTIKKGDLYWSKIGSYPYWPCIVTPDPINNQITSEISYFGKSYTAFHVRFFGDNGSRSWVISSKLIPYKGQDSLEDFVKNIKNKSYINTYKKGLKNKKWRTAIEEADIVNNCELETRISKFENILEQSKKDIKPRKNRKNQKKSKRSW